MGSEAAMTRFYYDPDAKPGTYVPPENKACRIWRYLDFPRYVSMLLSKGLYFARIDQLGDPFEGASPSSFLDNYMKLSAGRLVDGRLPPGLAEDRGRVGPHLALGDISVPLDPPVVAEPDESLEDPLVGHPGVPREDDPPGLVVHVSVLAQTLDLEIVLADSGLTELQPPLLSGPKPLVELLFHMVKVHGTSAPG